LDIVTIFPAMVRQALAEGVVGRAIDRGTLDVVIHDLRDFTTDRHRVVDDMPYGGGPGMVLKPEPIFRALDAIVVRRGYPLTTVLMSPQGSVFTQSEATRLSRTEHVFLLCGRYDDSFSRGLLDFPHYTRPAEVGPLRVPDVLLSGNHAEIRRWRKRESLSRTLNRRPELLVDAALDEEEREILRELVAERKT
jgi:tRNA (guanine37-N1)-methyltransferase